MLKNKFKIHIQSTNIKGSGKATSYIRALDLLCEMLTVEPLGFNDCKDIWHDNSIERLSQLYELVLIETRNFESSVWNIDSLPKSYLQNGFCSAALKNFIGFIVENSYELQLLNTFELHNTDEALLPEKLDIEIEYPNFLIDGLDEIQGEDVVRSVRVRANQNVFRKMVLKIYNQSCCITGLNIPEINRASHIIPWAKDASKRLDPRNGLCLSATYDAAFDRNLISLDDDYRIIISKEISDHYTRESVSEYFMRKEGVRITLPESYLPHKKYLSEHRKEGCF